MSLKAKIEAIIYAAEEPVTVDQILGVVADEISTELAALPTENSLPIGEESSETATAAVPSEAESTLRDAKQEAKQQRDRGRRRRPPARARA